MAALVAPAARASPAHDVQVAALRASLARGGISLGIRSAGAVVTTVGCLEVADRKQPSGCHRCILADDRVATDEMLATVTAEIDRYPTELLAQADIHTVDLCRRIDVPATNEVIGGFADDAGRRVMIAVIEGEVAAIVHHEMLHMIESARLSNLDADEGWRSTNPVGFSYGVGATDANARRPDGFVRPYATTNVAEDRASVFEYMMAKPDELCAIATSDPIIRAKAHIIWKRILTYASGYALVPGIAPCVQWLATHPRLSLSTHLDRRPVRAAASPALKLGN